MENNGCREFLDALASHLGDSGSIRDEDWDDFLRTVENPWLMETETRVLFDGLKAVRLE